MLQQYEKEHRVFLSKLKSEGGIHVAIASGESFNSTAIDGSYPCPIPGCLTLLSRKGRMVKHLMSGKPPGHDLSEYVNLLQLS